MRRVPRSVALLALVVACSRRGSRPAAASGPHPAAGQAHEAYVTAINSNNLDSLLAMLTEDVVFLPPHEPILIGKAAVRPWAQAYLGAFRIRWEKKSLEFVVDGDWAFELYSYKSTDTPQGGGTASDDTGKGIVIYHHDPDGTWRVARDAWNTDVPMPGK